MSFQTLNQVMNVWAMPNSRRFQVALVTRLSSMSSLSSLSLQMAMQRENVVFTSISNVSNTWYYTTKNSIPNFRVNFRSARLPHGTWCDETPTYVVARLVDALSGCLDIVCNSRDSPTAPSPPAADFAAQFDSLWSMFDREDSYFDYKGIDWDAADGVRPAMQIVSRWIEYTADGQVIEDVGIAPRVAVTSGRADFMDGRDPVLDWALRRGP